MHTLPLGRRISGFPIIFLQLLGLATSNLARSWGLPRPIIKNHTQKKGWRGPVLGKLSKIWGPLFNTYTMAEVINFNFGTQLGFANVHHKITPRGKVGVALG